MSTKKNDKYCWECFKGKTSLSCSECLRSFHNNGKCISKYDWAIADGKFMCPVCFEAQQLEQRDKQRDLDMLPVIIDKVWNNESFVSIMDILKDGIYPGADSTDVIVNPISLTSIRDNIMKYRSFDEFLADIHWIHHNCMILYSKNDVRTEMAALLGNNFKEEIDSLQSCFECYMNALNHPNDWFTMVCEEPHLIVWSKVRGYPYWPGKIMCVDVNDIYVNFFGEHENVIVSSEKCFLYSDTNPVQPGYTSEPYNLALKEAQQYLNNIQEKFGAYHLVTVKTPLNAKLIDKYIVDFVPGIVRHREAKRLNATKRKTISMLIESNDDFDMPNPKRSRGNEAETPGPSTLNHNNSSAHVLSIKRENENNDYTEPMLQMVSNESIRYLIDNGMNVNISPQSSMSTSQETLKNSLENILNVVQLNAKLMEDLKKSEQRLETEIKSYQTEINNLKQAHRIELAGIRAGHEQQLQKLNKKWVERSKNRLGKFSENIMRLVGDQQREAIKNIDDDDDLDQIAVE
ncbi:protein kinase C-binding protein 1-like [Contarinia nasturtii]|uniref:protein kinase C-binding protein 1-like n=1 Tax=Contarinia nasturtii TaxID=265458 RepID=UPI0012D46E49|nr:protein kinase C-binding protein 1-like [Contarinia nasturtii]XP_031639291.1 protein kinase C-binding protein 1-like [Contarinia nasturtii]